MTAPRAPGRPLLAISLLAAALALITGCGGSGGSGSSAPTAVPTPASSTASGLQILVTNDDGVSAPGIDVIVNRLRSLPGVDIEVVAPESNQSGTGAQTTPGAVGHQAATTAGGYRATSVAGYPADTVRVALDDLHLHPRLVVSGINKGQNVGAIASISGTVGAAKAAAARGIPALAVSQGNPADGINYDFGVGADYAIRVVQKLLPTLGTSAASTTTVQNLNVPSCDRGSVRGLRELPPDPSPVGKLALDPSDCTSTANPTDEITAFHDGFAVLTAVPASS
jgi:5'-nucleotidase